MFPSRWNRKGQRAVYTATSRALALSEVFVHLPKHSQPKEYSMLTITLDPSDVVLRQTLRFGRRWFETVGLALSEDDQDPIALIVPSVIVPEYNVILYPRSVNFEPELRVLNQSNRLSLMLACSIQLLLPSCKLSSA